MTDKGSQDLKAKSKKVMADEKEMLKKKQEALLEASTKAPPEDNYDYLGDGESIYPSTSKVIDVNINSVVFMDIISPFSEYIDMTPLSSTHVTIPVAKNIIRELTSQLVSQKDKESKSFCDKYMKEIMSKISGIYDEVKQNVIICSKAMDLIENKVVKEKNVPMTEQVITFKESKFYKNLVFLLGSMKYEVNELEGKTFKKITTKAVRFWAENPLILMKVMPDLSNIVSSSDVYKMVRDMIDSTPK